MLGNIYDAVSAINSGIYDFTVDGRCDKSAKGIQADRDMYHGKYGLVNVRRTFFLQKEGESD